MEKSHGFDLDGNSPLPPIFPGIVDPLSKALINICVDYFFTYVYLSQPILHRQQIAEVVAQTETNIEAHCLVLSLCTYIMMQPNINIPPESFQCFDVPPPNAFELGYGLLQKTICVRKSYNYVENPTVWTIISSFFLFESYSCLDRQDSAWFYLREATTLAQIIGMHDEMSYRTSDMIGNSQRRRMYWLLFVTERECALQQHKPITLHGTISLPTSEHDPTEAAELNGFIFLINLFRVVDETFICLWNNTRIGCTIEWLIHLQQQLLEALPSYLHCTESETVTLRSSQSWLRIIVWQLSIRQGLIPSTTANSTLSFQLPIEVAHGLIQFTSQCSQETMDSQGAGLNRKLFDVANALIEFMSFVPPEQFVFEYGPRNSLQQLMALIASLGGGRQHYLPRLMQKINDSLPGVLDYAISPVNAASSTSTDGLSIQGILRSESSSSFDSPLSAGTEHFGFPEVVVNPTMQYFDGPRSLSVPMYACETGTVQQYPGVATHIEYGTS